MVSYNALNTIIKTPFAYCSNTGWNRNARQTAATKKGRLFNRGNIFRKGQSLLIIAGTKSILANFVIFCKISFITPIVKIRLSTSDNLGVR